MLITVVMITYNHEKYIEKAIESVLSQEGNFEIELLIGNDKSPDKTEEILEKYKDNTNIKILNRKINMGATNNLWDLFIQSNGEYIAILEGDDYWLTKDKLQNQLTILEKNKKVILCYTDSYVIDENNNKIGKKSVKNKMITTLNSLIANRGEIPTGTILFRNIFKQNKNLNEIEVLLKSSEIIGDLSLFALLIKEGGFYKLEEFTGAYRYITNSKNSTSYSSRKNLYKEIELYKVFVGIANYYKMEKFKKFFFLERRKYNVKKEIKKEKIIFEDYFKDEKIEEKILEKLYIFLKPIDNLIWSINKKRYRK